MSSHGPAQLDLIRRYARTMREMHADAMRGRPPKSRSERDASARRPRSASEPIRQVAKAMTARAAPGGPDAGRTGAPTLPAA